MKQKYAEIIKAWADGAKIEVKCNKGLWHDVENPCWSDWVEYRIKPEQEINIVMKMFASPFYPQSLWNKHQDNLKITFDRNSQKIISVEIL